MSWEDTLKSVAPALASAMGGPLAGAAVGVIAKVFGHDKATADQVSALISGANPNQLLALKKADQEFAVQMKKLDVKDRDSARNLGQAVGILPQVILSSLYTAGYFFMIAEIMTGHVSIPDELNNPFNILLGIMTTAQIQIMNFWFGSSSGSQEKSRKIGI